VAPSSERRLDQSGEALNVAAATRSDNEEALGDAGLGEACEVKLEVRTVGGIVGGVGAPCGVEECGGVFVEEAFDGAFRGFAVVGGDSEPSSSIRGSRD